MTDQRSSRDPTAAAADRPARPSRRRVLAGLGAGLGTALLAGCSGVGNNSPSYEEGTVGDVEGDPRNAQEMATAEAVATRETNEGVTATNALSIEDHEFVLEDDFRGSTVQGTLENTGTERIQLVEIRVRVYDGEGRHLGRYLATTGDLEGGASWSFQVILLVAPGDVGSYDLAALGTPT